MPVELTSTESCKFVATASGKVTFAESAVFLDELLTHAQLHSCETLLVDGRTVKGAPSTAELRIIAHDLTPLRAVGVAHIAIVAGSPFIYGICRMFAVFAEAGGMSVAAFKGLEDAEQWLASFSAAA